MEQQQHTFLEKTGRFMKRILICLSFLVANFSATGQIGPEPSVDPRDAQYPNVYLAKDTNQIAAKYLVAQNLTEPTPIDWTQFYVKGAVIIGLVGAIGLVGFVR